MIKLIFIPVLTSLHLLLATVTITAKQVGSDFDKSAFYSAFASEDIDLINGQLNLITKSSIAEKDAYEGAMLMRKSGLLKGNTSQKLSLFKSGRSKLESCISRNMNNVEYRFLRLAIQEHAPKIVKYSNQIGEDCELIKNNYRNLPSYLQQAITDYCKSSKVLKLG